MVAAPAAAAAGRRVSCGDAGDLAFCHRQSPREPDPAALQRSNALAAMSVPV
jgi:hypothetical protein